MFKHTIRLMLIAAFAFALLGCELGGGDGDVAELRDQVANKDSQIASLQAQLSAQGGAGRAGDP